MKKMLSWPSNIDPDLKGVKVAVALTLPAYGGRPAVREVEQLYLDSIAAAKHTVYLENQYLSSLRISEALKQSLEKSDGPEVVIVLPKETGGWLEQHTMDVLRGRILKSLRESDRYDRIGIYYPRISEKPDCTLMVHAKVMVIDDDFVRVGSSNLSNRSMGLDSECDLAISAGSNEAARSAIVRFRNRLIAEHTGSTVDDVTDSIENSGSMIEAIESLSKGERRLVYLSGDVSPEIDQWVPESELLDPEQPLEPDELFDYFIQPAQQPFASRHLMKIILLIAGVLLLAALWRWGPAAESVDMESARAVGEWIRHQPLTPLLVVSAYILGGTIAFSRYVDDHGHRFGVRSLVGIVLCPGRIRNKCPGRLRCRSFLGARHRPPICRQPPQSTQPETLGFRFGGYHHTPDCSRSPLFCDQPHCRGVRNAVERFCHRDLGRYTPGRSGHRLSGGPYCRRRSSPGPDSFHNTGRCHWVGRWRTNRSSPVA